MGQGCLALVATDSWLNSLQLVSCTVVACWLPIVDNQFVDTGNKSAAGNFTGVIDRDRADFAAVFAFSLLMISTISYSAQNN